MSTAQTTAPAAVSHPSAASSSPDPSISSLKKSISFEESKEEQFPLAERLKADSATGLGQAILQFLRIRKRKQLDDLDAVRWSEKGHELDDSRQLKQFCS
jgi:hypothetical protein